MQRRTFIHLAGGVGMSSAGADSAAAQPRYFVLERYYLRNGTQLGRIHDFFSQGLVPAARFHSGPMIFLEALVAPHMPQVVSIIGFAGIAEVESWPSRLEGSDAYRKAFASWERGEEAPYEQYQRVLLRAASYNPPASAPPKPKSPRVYEVRVYHSPTWRQLGALHDRFAGPEIKIFHRVGVHPVFYSETVIGPDMPNLTYLIPFDDLAAREKAWNAFSADPEWIKVRRESIEAHGQISASIQISLYRAAPYSPFG